MQIKQEHNPDRVVVAYQIMAQGTQCAVFRAMFKRERPDSNAMINIGDWESILRYDGLCGPDMAIVLSDFNAMLGESIETLQRDILERQGGVVQSVLIWIPYLKKSVPTSSTRAFSHRARRCWQA